MTVEELEALKANLRRLREASEMLAAEANELKARLEARQ